MLAEANKWELSTADYPAGRHSNLSTIYLEKNKNWYNRDIQRNEEADIW